MSNRVKIEGLEDFTEEAAKEFCNDIETGIDHAKRAKIKGYGFLVRGTQMKNYIEDFMKNQDCSFTIENICENDFWFDMKF